MDDRVVVTGMAGTFPGARDVDALWNAVAVARVAPRASLASRWGIARERYMGAPGATDRTYTDLAFCVEDSARAGEKRDPQVRLGVRAIRGALADASRAGTPIDPRETGLVVATSWTAPSYFEGDAARALERFGVHVRVNGEAQDPAAQMAALGESLGGPRIAVDTACASSLYALDVALGLLEVGRARTVVVLGLNAMLPAFLYLGFAKLMALSPSGAIRPFAKDGDGIVPGECAAAVVLEKRDDARRAGRVSYGVVRSVGISADGSERSVFAPGAQGQQLAYERAYRGIDPRDVDYVEAHGTATAVGDETEIATLEAFFGRDRASRGHLPIGSVKSLVGHTLAAAGMVSLVKVLCMLRARTIPPHIEVEPHPSFVGTSLTLPRTSTPWLETPGRPRRAGISCFGFGGANAHVIVESDDDHAPASSSSSASIASSIPDEPLAIVDMETALGSADHFGRLPERFTMDAAGLRTGPNLIRRVDALQLLVTHLTRELLERNPSARGSTDTGVAMTSNLGGDLSLRLARRAALRLHGSASHATAAQSLGPELTPESIASSLPTMCSGYPAYHLNLRGFHQTFAGEPGAFWTTWMLAPYWLATRCRALVIGAATRAVGLEEGEAPRAEGACVFLVKPLSRAQADGDRVLATVRVVARTGEDGLALDPRAAPLAEATGVDLLVHAIRGDGGTIRLGALAAGRALVVTKEAQPEHAPRPMRMPLEIAFPARDTAAPAPTCERAKSGSTRTDVPPVSPRLSDVECAMEANAAALRAFFSAQCAAIGATAAARSHRPARRPENVVLARVVGHADRFAAELVVDESHSYFFDHPLDHVPGILLLEGIVQLAEKADAEVSVTAYVRRIDVRFRRFCEKDSSARIDMTRKTRGALAGRIVQKGKDLALFSLETAPGDRVTARAVARSPVPARVTDASLLHKHRAENVLVSPLVKEADGYVCALHAPPAGHSLADGPGRGVSPLFLLEGARQALMLGAHGVLGIPVGQPMNLVSVSLALDCEVPRGLPLSLHFVPGGERRIDAMTLADVRIAIRGAGRELGAVRIQAQVIDRATYQEQRKVTS